jgi:putative ABC transport system ATP-binding protein
MSFLATEQVCKYFHKGTTHEVRALDDVSLSVTKGSFVALTGPSGAGKSTLLALLGSLDRPTRGRILWDGADVSLCSDVELARVRRRVGFIFQSFALIPNLPVWENITYPLIPRGQTRAERYARARDLLSRFGLEGRLGARAQELSGGEQQRVAIARALAGLPELLLADEPTSNLDQETRQILLDMLKEMHAGGCTIVVSTHDSRILTLVTIAHDLRAGRLQAAMPGDHVV